MVNLVQDIAIDWEKYLRPPAESVHLRPISHYTDQVIASFAGGGLVGKTLPWSKSHADVRIRPNEISVWAGTNGHGKSILLSQILLGLASQGERVCLASFEMPPLKTIRILTRQAAGANEAAEEFVRDFHTWTDEKFWLYVQQTGVRRDRLLAVIRYCHEELNITQFAIDSMTKCGIAPDDYGAQKQFVDDLAILSRDLGVHIHLVAHVRKGENEMRRPDKFDIRGAGEISDLADNVFTFWRNKPKEEAARLKEVGRENEPDAVLTVVKQRHGEWEGPIALWFHPQALQFVAYDGARPIDFMTLAERAAIQNEGK